jgi:5'-nucleotidase (lipoprotein e(P4) family)
MKKNILIIVISLSIITGCTEQKSNTEAPGQDNLLNAVTWVQHSAEMKAIYYQSFNLAKNQLLENKANSENTKPKAVIVDIDETMLDNSPFEAKCIETGKGYTKEAWNTWISQIDAKALPGAMEFSKFVEKNNVDVFYISNRSVDNFSATLKNLQKENFAFADSSHLLLKSKLSSKKIRREKISSNYDIILLIGDNLNDFSEIFEDRTNNYGFDTVEQMKEEFSKRFIILPNSMYGAWEKAVYNNTYDVTEEEKTKLKKDKLISY